MTERFDVVITDFCDVPKKLGPATRFKLLAAGAQAETLKRLVVNQLRGSDAVRFYLVAERDEVEGQP